MKLYNIKNYPTFCGYQNPSFKESKVVILPIPYQGTVCYGAETAEGPTAIINASSQMETYDLEFGFDLTEKIKIHTLEPMSPNLDSPQLMMNDIEKTTEKIIKQKKFSVILGGEHSVSIGSVEAFKKKYKDLTVVQLDAHADLRNEYQNTKFSHACVMRRCREITNVVQVGIRSMSMEEAEFINKNNLQKSIFFSPELPIKEIIKGIGKNVYLTIDLDVLNPALMPAVGTPEPGGLIWYPFISFLKELFIQKNVVGADIVELAPIPGITAPNFTAAVIVYKIIGYKFFVKKLILK